MNYSATKWGNPDAYRLPDDGKYRTINFSGGHSSAYMLHQIWQAHDGILPETCRVIFCNTGKERPETLEFVRRCGEAQGYRPESTGISIHRRRGRH